MSDAEQEEPDNEEGEEEPTSEEVENTARNMGWIDKETYKGDPELWKEADVFVEDAEKDVRRMRGVNKYMERKIDKQEKSLEAILAHQEREVKTREEEAYERGRQEVETRIHQAVEDGDQEAAAKALDDRDKLKLPEKQGGPDPVFTEWSKENEWFNRDPRMKRDAIEYCDMAAQRGETPEQQLEGAAEYIRETYPEKFEKRKPKDAPYALNGGGNNVHVKNTAEPWSYEALTQEGRRECDLNVKQGTPQETWLRYARTDPSLFKGE